MYRGAVVGIPSQLMESIGIQQNTQHKMFIPNNLP